MALCDILCAYFIMADDSVQIVLLITCLCALYMFYQIVASANGDTVMWCMSCTIAFFVVALYNGNMILNSPMRI